MDLEVPASQAIPRPIPLNPRNVRGRGLMCAIDLPTTEERNALVKAAFAEQLLVLPCGVQSLRFRPFLNVREEHVQEMLARLTRALEQV